MQHLSLLLMLIFVLSPSIVAQEPTTADEYSQRAIARFKNSDMDGAIADFSKVIEMKGPSLEFCYYFRGMAHYRQGNPTQAIEDLTNAIAIKPDPRFLDDRGNLLARQGELDRAIDDLNKAIELGPQYAKAYGDRGLIQVMRGDAVSADLDFKKCFELDSSLESQFKAAANQLKQRTVSRYLHEKPPDVEITKFSWTEAPSKEILTPSQSPITVTTSAVSPTGTRVLANPGEKGNPGPGEILNPSGITAPLPQTPTENSRSFIDYRFNVSVKNTGNKTITAATWAYFFEPKNPSGEALSYLFTTKTNLPPGKEKTLNDSLNSSGKLPGKHNQALYNEGVAILSLEYSDGTTWQSTANGRTTEKKNQP